MGLHKVMVSLGSEDDNFPKFRQNKFMFYVHIQIHQFRLLVLEAQTTLLTKGLRLLYSLWAQAVAKALATKVYILWSLYWEDVFVLLSSSFSPLANPVLFLCYLLNIAHYFIIQENPALSLSITLGEQSETRQGMTN